MQVQEYTHARDAFESLNISENKINKIKFRKILKELSIELLFAEKWNSKLKEKLGWYNHLANINGKDYAVKTIQNDKRDVLQYCKDNFEWGCQSSSFGSISGWVSVNSVWGFGGEGRKFAVNKDGDYIVYIDCYDYKTEKIKRIIEVGNKKNIKITSFIKKYPNLCGMPGTDRPRVTPWKGEEDTIKTGHHGMISIHRGNLVGFIIHQNNI